MGEQKKLEPAAESFEGPMENREIPEPLGGPEPLEVLEESWPEEIKDGARRLRVNRKYKDRFFGFLFQHSKKNALSLYNA